MSLKKSLISAAVVIVLVILAIIVVRPSASNTGLVGGVGEPTGFDNVSLTGGLKVGVTAGDTSVPTYGDGSIDANGQIYKGGVTSTSTASTSAAFTLGASAFNTSLLVVNLGTTTVTTTMTLPATSSLASFLTNVGDETSITIYNASSTAGTLTVAGNTGVTLVSASSTVVIPAAGIGRLSLVRVLTGTIEAILSVAK